MTDNQDGINNQPDELNANRALVKEFLDKLSTIDNEIDTLKGDRKSLIEEFSTKLDMKTLKAAMRVVDISSKVTHKDTFDTFIEVLENP